jgi:hypothetical protein
MSTRTFNRILKRSHKIMGLAGSEQAATPRLAKATQCRAPAVTAGGYAADGRGATQLAGG